MRKILAEQLVHDYFEENKHELVVQAQQNGAAEEPEKAFSKNNENRAGQIKTDRQIKRLFAAENGDEVFYNEIAEQSCLKNRRFEKQQRCC